VENSLIIILLGLFVVAALIWFYAVRRPTPDLFIEELNDRYRIDDHKAIDVPLKCRVIGWRRTGSFPSMVIDQWSSIGTDNRYLYLSLWSGIPVFSIPLRDLKLIGTRFFWTALLSFDVYEIDGVATGQLYVPVGFLGDGITIDA
jgi:hypothetical protein